MDQISHEQAKELFTDYQENSLPTEQKELLETHLASCERCQLEWQKFHKMMEALSGLREKKPDTNAPDLLQGTTKKIHQRTHGRFFRHTPGRFGVRYEFIAGILLLLIAAIYLLVHAFSPKVLPPNLPEVPSRAPKAASTQSAKNPPKIQGRIVQSYTISIAIENNDTNKRHIERIVQTANGTLSDWSETENGLSVNFQIPQENFVRFYTDLGASFPLEKTTKAVKSPDISPPIEGTIELVAPIKD